MKPYSDWGTARKIFTNILFWLPVQFIVIMILDYLHLAPRNLFPDASTFGGPAGGIIALAYLLSCILVGIVYTISGSILIAKVQLGSRKFWIWFTSLYLLYMATSLAGLYASIQEWFFEGFGYYILDVWAAPLLWIGELFIAKAIYNGGQQRRRIVGDTAFLNRNGK